METDWNKLFESNYMGPVKLYPNEKNLLYKKPVVLEYSNGYFFGKEGPDFYFRDVADWNNGYHFVKEQND